MPFDDRIKRKQSYLIVQEYEIHLDEDECHPGGRSQRQQHVVAFGVPFQLKVLPELQPGVDHASDSECCKAVLQITKSHNFIVKTV